MLQDHWEWNLIFILSLTSKISFFLIISNFEQEQESKSRLLTCTKKIITFEIKKLRHNILEIILADIIDLKVWVNIFSSKLIWAVTQCLPNNKTYFISCLLCRSYLQVRQSRSILSSNIYGSSYSYRTWWSSGADRPIGLRICAPLHFWWRLTQTCVRVLHRTMTPCWPVTTLRV